MHRVFQRNPSREVHIEHAEKLYDQFLRNRDKFYAQFLTPEVDPGLLLNMLATLAMLRVEMRNLDGTYGVGPNGEDFDDIDKRYKSLKAYAVEMMERASYDPPPGFNSWERSYMQSKRQERRPGRLSRQERQAAEAFVEGEDVSDKLKEKIRVSPDARRYQQVVIRPGAAEKKARAKMAADLISEAKKLRSEGMIQLSVRKQAEAAQLMGEYDIDEAEVRKYLQ